MIEFAPPLPSQTNQVVLVVGPDWRSPFGTLTRYEKLVTGWTRVGDASPVSLGSEGLAWGRGVSNLPKPGSTKKEGDGKTPAGLFKIGSSYGPSPLPPEGVVWPYQPIDQGWFCVDDSKSSAYNRVVSLSKTYKDWTSAETMLRPDDLYKWVINIEHNFPDVKLGAGSCIFFHVWRGAGVPTKGCVAMEEETVLSLLRWLKPFDQPLLAILPQNLCDQLKVAWGWPC